ncbi:MAG: 2-hydroxyacyl-CoA dehydratase subunit D [Desulfobacterales bacterium]
MEPLEKLRTVAHDPFAYAQDIQPALEKPVIGYFCSYTPEEILTAAGAMPFRIFGTRGDISLADAHLQSYCCSLVRGGLEDALKGRLSFLRGAVFPHTCDSIQRLSDIWRLNAGLDTHFDLVLPVKLTTQSARAYMISVLNTFRAELEQGLDVSISDEALHQAIYTHNRIRDRLGRIYQLKSQNPGVLAAADMYAIMKAAMVMDRAELLEHLDALWADLSAGAPEGASTGRKRILMSGGICNHPDIYHFIEEAGGDVVWDDLCTGTRYFEGSVEETGDPVEAIADRYLDRMVCPAKHMGVTARGEHLKQLVRTYRIDGVIFLFLKFCDPHGFDYPYLKEFMDQAGVPTLLLEVEEQLPGEGQFRTRFETFIDML